MKKHLLIGILLLSISGCNLIDDDLSVCGVDCTIDYELKLVADLNMSIHTQLQAEQDSAIAKVLENWISPIFHSDQNEVELSFFSMNEADELHKHSVEQITARRQSFTFYLPRENYQHVAVMNVADNDASVLMGTSHSASMRISTKDVDTLPSQKTAIYAARCPIELENNDNQSFEVSLYAASCAVALVLDSAAFSMPKIEVLLSDMASGMSLNDSTFLFERNVLTRSIAITGQCFGAISLPSRDELPSAAPARRKGKTNEVAALWQLTTHVTLPDGKITETILSIDEPLRAGAIKIIKCEVQADGSLVPVQTSHVGATVTLDWKQGSEHEIDI